MLKINVRDFIVNNYTPYDGDESFLEPATERTKRLWEKVSELMKQEREKGGVLSIDSETISDIDAYAPGYIDKENEQIVGLQTDEPLRRAIIPFGGIRMVKKSLSAYGEELPERVADIFKYRKTHNDGVFDVYTEEIRKARHSGIITGLPDSYGRGRIIGDYRRVPLYGVSALIEEKEQELKNNTDPLTERKIRHREEISEQIKALHKLVNMASSYGFDITRPAENTKEAFQWLYFAYLAATKQQNGAAMSLGRVSTFLDIYAERDLQNGTMNESQIQELTDHFVMKLRMIRFLRTPDYDELFSGDPTWVTEAIGGMCLDGRHMVTKMSYRFLHTLCNLGAAPEPNMTVLWDNSLPESFKRYCCKMSIETSSIQYESDTLMRKKFGDDYAIACCVSAMRVGKQMQFFGARANLAKALLYAINGGRDEISGDVVIDGIESCGGEALCFEDVARNFDKVCAWLARVYVGALNCVHYMHDKYCYESLQMALHDDKVVRTFACGIAGLSVTADSLAAIKYARVIPKRNESGLCTDFEVVGTPPAFGNNDKRVDSIANALVKRFMHHIRRQKTYRNAEPTLSVLTITSNVVYGKKTGATPDGRKKGEPFAPGANPMHGRDKLGSIASMMSVAQLPYDYAEDGISYTFSIIPQALGTDDEKRKDNLKTLLDGYFKEKGHHINVNVIRKEILEDAMEHPENYPQLTIRVSGYAVNFIRLTKEQQLDVINRTFHTRF